MITIASFIIREYYCFECLNKRFGQNIYERMDQEEYKCPFHEELCDCTKCKQKQNGKKILIMNQNLN